MNLRASMETGAGGDGLSAYSLSLSLSHGTPYFLHLLRVLLKVLFSDAVFFIDG